MRSIRLGVSPSVLFEFQSGAVRLDPRFINRRQEFLTFPGWQLPPSLYVELLHGDRTASVEAVVFS